MTLTEFLCSTGSVFEGRGGEVLRHGSVQAQSDSWRRQALEVRQGFF